jgi:hypothetical protein
MNTEKVRSIINLVERGETQAAYSKIEELKQLSYPPSLINSLVTLADQTVDQSHKPQTTIYSIGDYSTPLSNSSGKRLSPMINSDNFTKIEALDSVFYGIFSVKEDQLKLLAQMIVQDISNSARSIYIYCSDRQAESDELDLSAIKDMIVQLIQSFSSFSIGQIDAPSMINVCGADRDVNVLMIEMIRLQARNCNLLLEASSLRQMYEQLQQSFRKVDDYLSSIAYENKNRYEIFKSPNYGDTGSLYKLESGGKCSQIIPITSSCVSSITLVCNSVECSDSEGVIRFELNLPDSELQSIEWDVNLTHLANNRFVELSMVHALPLDGHTMYLSCSNLSTYSVSLESTSRYADDSLNMQPFSSNPLSILVFGSLPDIRVSKPDHAIYPNNTLSS